jgi:hypothetical protein
MMAVNLNLNNAECLREVANLTERTIYNVCTGTTTTVPYGTLDIIGMSLLAFLLIVVFSGFALIFYGMSKI